jgi:5-methylcytosine-specific restriction endonuclease McrA
MAQEETRLKARARWLREGTVTRKDLEAIVERDKACCVYCGDPVASLCDRLRLRGFDHVLSQRHGGRHEASNLVVCCQTCNASKRHKPAGTRPWGIIDRLRMQADTPHTDLVSESRLDP